MTYWHLEGFAAQICALKQNQKAKNAPLTGSLDGFHSYKVGSYQL